jgi:hypothetical protein
MEVLVTFDELSQLLSKALNTEVTRVTFIPEGKIVIETNLDLLGIQKPSSMFPVYTPPVRGATLAPMPLAPPIPPTAPETTPEELSNLLNESLRLEGVVYEYNHEGDIVTRKRMGAESTLPAGEPIIYVRGKNDE